MIKINLFQLHFLFFYIGTERPTRVVHNIITYNIQIISIMLKLLLITIIFVSLPLSLFAYTCTDTSQKSITIGNEAIVCIHIVTQTPNESVKTYAFKTTVDTFSALKINKLKDSISENTVTVIQVAKNNSVVTPDIIIYNKNNQISRSLFSFVINIDKGNITTIVDDTPDCSVCATSSTTQKCDESTNNKCFDVGQIQVEPRFFISWIGTDTDDNYMLSHTKRLSRFSQYSIGGFYQGLVSQFK